MGTWAYFQSVGEFSISDADIINIFKDTDTPNINARVMSLKNHRNEPITRSSSKAMYLCVLKICFLHKV